MRVPNPLRLLAALALVAAGAWAQAQTEVTIYTYNDRPPFIIDKAKGDGLEYRLVTWLNKESKGAYHFTLKVVPGNEAKAMAGRDDFQGLLFDINDHWVSPETRAKVLWTPPVLFDRQLVISPGKKRIAFAGTSSLEGHTFAGVKAYFYPAITDLVAAGRITRTDTESEVASLKLVDAGKVDFAIVSEWTLMYEQLRAGLEGDFYTADKPFETVERYILVPKALKAVHEHLTAILKDVRKNPDWEAATSL